ncbi:hypothetical protein BDV95DRAFT_564030 [Massariosphaeria phaeospora]|uniref:F-box domain-containing protein n=1 Tax=Massariosphaeria phaeospora TaxID=100035 RepID=A0A7C8ID07_9PLEO|nr:hypothetical protein BDV95DRAFT_564030 [Massariosphaeria phaeospora]
MPRYKHKLRRSARIARPAQAPASSTGPPTTSTQTRAAQTALTQPPPTSALLRLPAELRNLIYEYAVGGETIELHQYRRREYRQSAYQLTLPLVSRQLHAETALLFYSTNHFSFRQPIDIKWFVARRTEEQIAAITSVQGPPDLYSSRNEWTYSGVFPGLKELHVFTREYRPRSDDENTRQAMVKEKKGMEISFGERRL